MRMKNLALAADGGLVLTIPPTSLKKVHVKFTPAPGERMVLGINEVHVAPCGCANCNRSVRGHCGF